MANAAMNSQQKGDRIKVIACDDSDPANSLPQKEQTPLRTRSVSAHRAHPLQANKTMNTKELIRLGVPEGI
ncbi:MAG: hypothetical protein ACR2OZ_01280 [Verrucomicrobiales bacterium]